jgi:TetR/AcrR family transcriptional repressor of nem operon
MGRHLEFDIPTAKKAAIKLFWSKGYQAATLDLLCERMQIGRSSFYATFKDKKSLFIECLDTYLEGINKDHLRISKGGISVENIREAYLTNFVHTQNPRANMGCMMANIAVELADVDDELVKILRDKLQVMDTWRIEWFVQMGCPQPLAKRLGNYLSVFTEGLQISSRRKISRAQLQEVIHTGFDFLAAEVHTVDKSLA